MARYKALTTRDRNPKRSISIFSTPLEHCQQPLHKKIKIDDYYHNTIIQYCLKYCVKHEDESEDKSEDMPALISDE